VVGNSSKLDDDKLRASFYSLNVTYLHTYIHTYLLTYSLHGAEPFLRS